jgi:hypothetical protein
VRSTFGAELLAECLGDNDVIDVLKMQPPDGMTVRDVLGNVYTIMIYEQATQRELDEARSLEP